MTTQEQLDRLAGIVESLAGGVVAHDRQIDAHTQQIGAMLDLAATQQKQIEAHDAQIAALLEVADTQVNSLDSPAPLSGV
jgi:hypothetical protein